MNKKGFTLIELLAVIVILAIILAIAVPSITTMINNSKKSACESNAKMVLKAIEYKKLENNSFDPTTVNENTISNLLNLSAADYESVDVIVKDKSIIISIVGKNKWKGLIACGTNTNMMVVENISDCGPDLVPPTITLNGDSTVNMGQGSTYSDMGATATDNRDGDITSDINTTSNVDTNIVGTYTVTYTVSDAAGNTVTATRTVNVLPNYAGPGYISSKGVNGPTLATGMTPIKWNGTSWVDTTVFDTEWYNYTTTDKKWANARTADGSMWVWIPRYIYKISSGWHTNSAGTINTQFSKVTDDNWNSSSIGNISTDTTSNASNNTWTNHPAFTFGSTELTGIWVAKFEASNDGSNNVKIVPNVTSWVSISENDVFNKVRSMETNSVYGWGTAGSGIDTHMMKNTEWGAVAYLSKSNYGKNAKIWTNNSNTYITGCAGDSVLDATSTTGCEYAYNTTNGLQASTTGNIYGIYDIAGGVYEYTAAYVDNANLNLSANGSSLVSADSKYKDVYAMGSADTNASNYPLAINQKGDAIYETSVSYTGSNAWYIDYSNMPYSSGPWFQRGGYSGGGGAGAFHFHGNNGYKYSYCGFRGVVLVGAGL